MTTTARIPRLWLETIREDYGAVLLEPIIADREIVPRAYSERMPLAYYEGGQAADVLAAFDQIAAELTAKTKGKN